LGFSDKDEHTRKINNSVVTNYGDGEKVWATVAATFFEFTNKFPDAMVIAIGSAKARTRLYRIGITNDMESIKPDKDFSQRTTEKKKIPRQAIESCEEKSFYG